MFSFAFIANIVVLAIGGMLLLVGILLLGYGIFALVRSRRAPEHESPSYSASVEYPAENGIDADFEDAPQWASGIAADKDVTGDAEAVGTAEAAGGAGERAETSPRKGFKNGRETALISVGALLALLGVYMLLNTIALIS